MFDFEKFPVYQKSEIQYSKIIKILSNSRIYNSIKDQLKRAFLSIVLNIAEWAWKFTKNDKKNFYLISKGSVNEFVTLLRILKIEGLISDYLFTDIYSDLLEIAKMLSWLINSMVGK